MPQPGDAADWDRFAYVRNNPLKYTDPTGHDIMIVGGYSGEDWNDPEAWKEWIVAYTGWSDGQWNKFRNDWRDPDIDRDVLMYDTGVHIFNWDASGKGYDAKSASRRTSVEEALPLLDAQMAGMQDITLIGHSKGGNLVLNYVRSLDGRSSQVKSVVVATGDLRDRPFGRARHALFTHRRATPSPVLARALCAKRPSTRLPNDRLVCARVCLCTAEKIGQSRVRRT